MSVEQTCKGSCFRPFVNMVSRHFAKGGDTAGVTRLVDSALKHDRFKLVTTRFGLSFDHGVIFNRKTLNTVAAYEAVRHKTGYILPSVLVLTAPLLALGASNSGDERLGDGTIIQHNQHSDGYTVIHSAKGGEAGGHTVEHFGAEDK